MNGLVKIILVTFIIYISFPALIQARRITPEDIVNAKKIDYQEKVDKYSAANKKKSESMVQKIAESNFNLTSDLDRAMVIQAAVLDEYERRSSGKNKEGIEKARYQVTYAHEAVAFQAAKIYVFNLTVESSLNRDILSTINILQNDLVSTRAKVIYSQKVLEQLVAI